MADNAILFKYAVKSIGMKFGIVPSFMAKPWGNVCPVISILALCTKFIHISSSQDVVGKWAPTEQANFIDLF